MKKKILIIDDDLSWRRLLKRIFGGIKYDVRTAASCAGGVKMAKRHKPDCILLDFHLGDGDAVSVCAKLRKNGKKFNIPVIVVSSDSGAERTAYEECRAAYFVLKGSQAMMELPVSVEKLLLNREGSGFRLEPSS